MVRPRKRRMINNLPRINYFKPAGIPMRDLEEINLTLEELEALRLINIDELNQTEAAEKMQVHQSTFNRTLSNARNKITQALINGWALKIEGGDYKMPKRDGTGPNGDGPKTGRGRGNCK